MFEGAYKVRFHLAPPILNKPDPATGEARKSVFGPWLMGALGILAKLKRLRGTALDIFGRTEERRAERQLIADYETTVQELLARLTRDNLKLAIEIAAIPEEIRGFGHVKSRHLKKAKDKEAKLLDVLRGQMEEVKAA
jgi:indolepyruvate ferredoxin oxidoreductase